MCMGVCMVCACMCMYVYMCVCVGSVYLGMGMFTYTCTAFLLVKKVMCLVLFDATQVVTLREIPFVDVMEMPADGVCKPVKKDSNSFPCLNHTTGKPGPWLCHLLCCSCCLAVINMWMLN